MAKEVRFRIAVENAAKKSLDSVRKGFERIGRVASKAMKRGKIGADDFRMSAVLLSAGIARVTMVASLMGAGVRKAFSVVSKAAKTATIATVALGAALLKTIKVAANRKDLEIGLGKLIGDMERGKKLFQELVDFSDVTPFEVEPLVSATQKLMTFGFTADEVIPKLQLLGDATSAMNKPLEEVALAYGRFASAARQGAKTIDADVLNSLRDAGLLSEDLRKEILKLMKSGKGLEALKLFEDKSLRKFSGSMAELSTKFNGLVSTIRGKLNTVLAKFGSVFLPDAENAAKRLADALDRLGKSGRVQELAKIVRTKLGGAIEWVQGRFNDFVQSGGLEKLKKDATALAATLKQTFTDLFGGDEKARNERLAKIQIGIMDTMDKAADIFAEKMIEYAPAIGEAMFKGVAGGVKNMAKRDLDVIKQGGPQAGEVIGKQLYKALNPFDPLAMGPRIAENLFNRSRQADGQRSPEVEMRSALKGVEKNTKETKQEVSRLGL